MKYLQLCACSFMVAASAFAGPLDKSKVSSGAKWLLHLDWEAFRQSHIGSHLTEKVIQPKLNENEGLKKLQLSLNLQNIASITAYGPVFEKNGEGVLMISSTADLKKDFEKLAGLAALSDGGNQVTLVQNDPFVLYRARGDVFIAPDIAGTAVLAKSREQITHAREVLLGKADNLAQSTAFQALPDSPNGYFVVMAEGFNETAPFPPQAQILRETRGGRLVAGESANEFFAHLAFKGKDQEATLKIQQVLQGIIALISLSQNNKELTELAAATRISSEKDTVVINLKVPVTKAVEKIDNKRSETL